MIWKFWCWCLDICTDCEQTYPYHSMKCAVILEKGTHEWKMKEIRSHLRRN